MLASTPTFSNPISTPMMEQRPSLPRTLKPPLVHRPTNLDGLLEQLSYRLRTQPEFPHEIGVFLGYPLRDVIGFIENHGRNFTCCGFWKSYGDPAEMQVCFACYRRCIQTYVAMFEQGIPIERLAVPA